ncbi:hypothetical protein KFE25_012790 [Diacronema lutheri]|uniref:F-box domain-containing protein n=1 Tax=Diacronema lutheri TaxID=2081491 RepID=A0A8J6C722_DIALT|nr:hypothetical protein KFE25_012790 [Diacronema lutheri]
MLHATRPGASLSARRVAAVAPAGACAALPSLALLAPELLAAICRCLPAEHVAALRATCRTLRGACGDRALWAGLLAERFGDAPDPVGELAALDHPSRIFARLAVCARWGLARTAGGPPAADGSPPSPENAGVGALATRVHSLRLNVTTPDARKALSYLDLNAGGATPPTPHAGAASAGGATRDGRVPAAAAASPGAGACAPLSLPPHTPAPTLPDLLQKRLRRDLLELVSAPAAIAGAGASNVGAIGAVSAFPVQEDMLVWNATVRGISGRPDADVTFRLVLAFGVAAGRAVDADAASARRTERRARARGAGRRGGTPASAGGGGSVDDADAHAHAHADADAFFLPVVRVVSPPVAHPNVRADGTVCAAALRARCRPADPVRAVLLGVRELLDRPHLGVRPLNRAAALEWALAREPLGAARGCAAAAPAGAPARVAYAASNMFDGSPLDLNRAPSAACGAPPLTPRHPSA